MRAIDFDIFFPKLAQEIVLILQQKELFVVQNCEHLAVFTEINSCEISLDQENCTTGGLVGCGVFGVDRLKNYLPETKVYNVTC